MSQVVPQSMSIDFAWEDYVSTRNEEAKDFIITYYLFIVERVVRRMMPVYGQYCEYDDLIGYGVLGLIDAIDKYDLDRNVKFESYAMLRVKGEILDNIRKLDWAPSSMRSKIKSINKAYEELEATGMRVNEQDVAEYLKMDVTSVRKIQDASCMFNVVSFESMLSNEFSDGNTIADIIGDDPERQPERIAEKKQLRQTLVRIIEDMPSNEKMVIQLYYYEELMLKDIAKILKISESRASQLHSKALSRLQEQLKEIYDKD